MKRTAALWLLLLAGCSTAPFADVMDYFSPGRIRRERVPPYGGVCAPHPVGSVPPSVPLAATPPPGAVITTPPAGISTVPVSAPSGSPAPAGSQPPPGSPAPASAPSPGGI